MTDSFDEIAPYYEWILPDEALTGVGTVALAAAGYRVVAADTSHAMVDRTRRRAASAGASVETRVSRWEDLPSDLVTGGFDVVLCLGNSLVQNNSDDALRAAVAAMRSTLASDGYLVIDSRNWELLRAQKRQPYCDTDLIERNGFRCVSVRSWTLPDQWEEAHMVNIALTLIDYNGSLKPVAFMIESFPIQYERMLETPAHAGLRVVSDNYNAEREWYTIVSQKPTRATIGG